MRITLPLLICATLAITGCARVSQMGLNPFNWFGASTQTPRTASGPLRPLVPANKGVTVVDGRGMIQDITALVIEKTSNGAIVRATGTASTQGQFNAQLVPVSNDGGVLTMAFRIEMGQQTGANTAGSRQVSVARVLTTTDLSGVRIIVVQAARNQRSAAR